MNFHDIAIILVALVSFSTLGGCQPPKGGEYNYGANDAPTFDAPVYATKTSPDFYDATHYNEDTFDGRQ